MPYVLIVFYGPFLLFFSLSLSPSFYINRIGGVTKSGLTKVIVQYQDFGDTKGREGGRGTISTTKMTHTHTHTRASIGVLHSYVISNSVIGKENEWLQCGGKQV